MTDRIPLASTALFIAMRTRCKNCRNVIPIPITGECSFKLGLEKVMTPKFTKNLPGSGRDFRHGSGKHHWLRVHVG